MNGLRWKTKALCWAAGLAASAMLALLTGCGSSGGGRPAAAAHAQPLDYGWSFACAITNSAIDLSDRSQCQERVALAYLAAGEVEKARACALQIEDWQKGMALAKVAEWYAVHGQAAKAEAMLPELEACGFIAKDWQRDWLRVAITRVRALLGRDQEVIQSVSNFAGHANLGGDAAASLALMLARTGQVDDAKTVLSNLARMNGLDAAASRAQGYLDLVAAGRLDPKTAPDVLTNAWDATDRIKPYRRWEVQMTVIEAMATHDLAAEAREHLEEVASNVVATVKLPPEVRASILSQGALLWKRLGEPQRGVDLLHAAEQTVTNKLEVIFQPEAYAKLAEGYAAAGDAAQAHALYTRALDIAAGLVNRRPRAIAGVDVCVSLAGHTEVIDTGIQERLDRLLARFNATVP